MKKLMLGLLLVTSCSHFRTQPKRLNHFEYEAEKCKITCSKLDEVVSSFDYYRKSIDTSKNTIGGPLSVSDDLSVCSCY
jgi:hypothetical protein